MDGNEFRVNRWSGRIRLCVSVALLWGCFPFADALAADEELDSEFLEWLGQMAEMEGLGVDIEQILLDKEQATQEDEAEVSTK